MPVDTRHPQYTDAREDWLTIRDCIGGERWVKSGGDPSSPERYPKFYLPKPSGMDESVQGKAQWEAYLARASFPAFVSDALRGSLGILFRKRGRLDVPTRMQYLESAATPEGMNFWSLEREIATDQLSYGRHILMAELPRDGDKARIMSYPPETLINWRYEMIGGERKLTLAVLELQSHERDEDEFVSDPVTDWLVLRLRNGVYMQDQYRKDEESGKPILIESGIIPTIRDEPLTEIPLQILGSIDMDASPDERPILGLCNTALKIYQVSADYYQALFMVSQPTPWVSGVHKDDEGAPQSIGSSTIWYLPDVQAKAGFLEYTGAGVGSQRQAMLDGFDRAAQQGAQLLETTKRVVESAEALRLRQGAKNATIQTIADVLSEGVNKVLSYVALWNDVDPKEAIYEPNMDFVDDPMDAQEMREIAESWIKGAIGPEVLYHRYKMAEILPEEMDFEAFQRDRGASNPPEEMSNG